MTRHGADLLLDANRFPQLAAGYPVAQLVSFTRSRHAWATTLSGMSARLGPEPFARGLPEAAMVGIRELLGARCCHCRLGVWPVCPVCRSEITAQVAVGRVADVPVVSAARYAGHIRSAILAVKRTGNAQLSEVLAQILQAAIITRTRDGTLPGEAAIVPVPSGGRTHFANGGDFAVKLLERAVYGEAEPKWQVTPMLHRVPFARAQKKRRATTRGDVAFLAGGGRRVDPGRTLLLLDDVMTTGSSLRCAANVLAAHGYKVSGALVLARV